MPGMWTPTGDTKENDSNNDDDDINNKNKNILIINQSKNESINHNVLKWPK